ncbi:MAG: hypothetical protein JRF56_00070 [Deltaproteobacteria bacterium]|jgi:hypothetical protein|nr:hypothetical protein [Deltaproteobacteria bacterium]
MAKQQFADVTIRNHISNVAHFSHSLNGIKLGIEDLDELIQSFLSKHIPSCKCKGWKQLQQTKRLSYSLNRFKNHLFDCHGLDFKSENLAYSKIHHEYSGWLSEKFKLENSTIKIRSNYLKQFLQWHQENSNDQALQALNGYDDESFFIKATSRLGTAYKRSLQATLRSFFDFCHQHGYIIVVSCVFHFRLSRPIGLVKFPKKLMIMKL